MWVYTDLGFGVTKMVSRDRDQWMVKRLGIEIF